MSEPTPNPRPHQVTLAGWLTMVGSAIVVLLVFDRVSGLHTIESRESVEQFLAEPPGRGLGLTADQVLDLIRVASLVTGACAAAAAILGYHVLQRSRGARLALTVVAVPLFLTGLVTGGFLSSVVAGSVVLLWMQPARDWFDGIARREQSAPAPAAAATTAARSPLAHPAGGQPATPHPAYAAPQAGPPGGPAGFAGRPPAVAWACILTWVGSGLTMLGSLAVGVVLGLQPDLLIDGVREQNPDLDVQGVTDGMLLAVTFAMLAGFALWCAGAAVLAFFVLRGHEWARVVLLLSAATASGIFLIGAVVGAFVLAITLATSAAAIVLLIRPEVRAWFAQPRP